LVSAADPGAEVKVLFVGDIHATPEELDDVASLMKLVEYVALDEEVDVVCLLGDSYHTHNIIRAEVMAFYRETFKRWKKIGTWETLALVGNHDYAGEGQLVHAMMIHEEQIRVVDAPLEREGVLFMPYYADREKFVQDAQPPKGEIARTLVCHQTFSGASYENGFKAEDGVDPALIPHSQIISGHIHAPQSFGKVTYLGAPRWRILSDANTDRAIWVYEFSGVGNVVSSKPVTTAHTCRQIRYAIITPNTKFDEVLDPSTDWRIDIRGPSDFVEEQRAKIARAGVRVRCFNTDQAAPKVRESEGIDVAFRAYLAKYNAKYGTNNEELASMAKERLGV
jgi:DNA repair exonuclease SbcCD nuclease subunit